jgi:transcriptional regulator with GAF, ATPase, and Fis domain/uncharacterized protein HemY
MVLFNALEVLVNRGILIRTVDKKGYIWSNHHLRELFRSNLSREDITRFSGFIGEKLLQRYHREKDPQFLFAAALHLRESRKRKRAFEVLMQATQIAKQLRDVPKALQFTELAYQIRKSSLSPREAIHLLTEQAEFHSFLAEHERALDKLNEALKLATRYRLPEKKDLLLKLGELMIKRFNIDTALKYFDILLKENGSIDNVKKFRILKNICWVFIVKKDFKKAEEILEKLSSIVKNVPNLSAQLHNLRAKYFWQKDDIDGAINEASMALNYLVKNSPQDPYLYTVYYDLGSYYWHKGELDRSENYYKKSLQLAKKSFNLYHTAHLFSSLGLIYFQRGQLDKARTYLEESLNLAQKIGSHSFYRHIYINLAGILEAQEGLEAALSYIKKAEKLSLLSESGKVPPIIFLNLGATYDKKGDWESALEKYEASLRRAEEEGDVNYIIWSILRILRLKRLMGRETKSEMEKLKNYVDIMDQYQRYAFYEELLERSLIGKDLKKAEALLNQIKELATNDKALFSGYQVLLAKVLIAKEDYQNAIINVKKAQKMYKELNLYYESAQAGLVLTDGALRAIEAGRYIELTYQEVDELLEEAEGIFKKFGAQKELQRVNILKNRLLKVILAQSHRPPQRYLKALYQISEIVNLYLNKTDFFEELLTKVINLTGAERGALFLVERGEFVLAASKDLDRTTLSDAREFSQSIVKEATRSQGPILSNDAVNDPRFSFARSIKVNNIRSILVTRLTTEGRLIGVLYLDSRIKPDLFREEEVEFLNAVSHILAATIDKTLAYRKLEEELLQLREGLIVDGLPEKIVANSPKMKECIRLIEQVAPTSTNILLIGETGTGKSVLARLIHQKSGRKGSFVKVDLGNVSDTLFESELFGYAKGAFTGAYTSKKGLLEEAAGGTLFLDEITNIPLSVQAKLLTVIEEKVFRRLGENKERKADFRVVCATNRDIEKEVREGRFREDLYYRLSTWIIRVPPLRERVEDIPALAQLFIDMYNKEFGVSVKGLSKEALELFLHYPWPGNIRELKNVIERAVLLAQGPRIDVEDLEPSLRQTKKELVSLRKEQEELEINRLKEALALSSGNVSEVAKYLGIRREQLTD